MSQLGDRVEHAIDQRADVEHEIERGEAARPRRARIVRSMFWLAVTGVSLYLVAPSLIDVFGSWDDLDELAPGWLAAMAGLQTLALACLWALQYLAMRGPSWPAVGQLAAGGQRAGEDRARRWRARRRAAVPDARQGRAARQPRGRGPDRGQPARLRGGPGHAGARRARDPARRREPPPGRADPHRPCRARRAVRDRDGDDRLRRPLAWVGRVVQRVRNRLRRHSEPSRAAARAPPARAHAARRDPRPALEARAGGDLRPLGVRLRVAARRAGRRRLRAAPGARAARVLRRPGAGADPDHAGRARVRRGRADGHARADRGPAGIGGARHLRLPAVLLLAAAPGRARRVRLARAALRVGGGLVERRHTLTARRRRPWSSRSSR